MILSLNILLVNGFFNVNLNTRDNVMIIRILAHESFKQKSLLKRYDFLNSEASPIHYKHHLKNTESKIIHDTINYYSSHAT